MFKIGDFSKLSNTSIRMLRHYDQMELLKPGKIDTDSNYRYYTAVQLESINIINSLKHLGFSLANIKEIIDKKDDDYLETHLHIRQKELKEELKQVQIQINYLDALKNKAVSEDMIKYHVSAKEIPARNVVSLRKTITILVYVLILSYKI